METIRPVPLSKSRTNFYESAHIPVREMRDGILHCHVNPFALSSLHSGYKELASEEYMKRNARLTGFCVEPFSDKYVVTSLVFGRALPLAYGFISYADMTGGVVVQKGGGLSGKKFTLLEANEPLGVSPKALGFYGKKEAEREINFSNILIQHGFRASLPLGYAELDPDWVIHHIESSFLKAIVTKSLSQVQENGDVPVVLFRIDGTVERYSYPGSSSPSKQRFQAELARGSRLLLHECDLQGSLMQRYIGCMKDEGSKMISVLKELEKRNPLGRKDCITFLHFLSVIAASNASGIKKLEHHPAFQNRHVPFDRCSPGKDIDLSHSVKDFEYVYTIPKEKRKTNGVVETFLDYIQKSTKNLFLSMEANACLKEIRYIDLCHDVESFSQRVKHLMKYM